MIKIPDALIEIQKIGFVELTDPELSVKKKALSLNPCLGAIKELSALQCNQKRSRNNKLWEPGLELGYFLRKYVFRFCVQISTFSETKMRPGLDCFFICPLD